MTKLAAVSIDLDEVGCYCAIHGLAAPDAQVANAIYDKAVPRIERLLSEMNIPATFFAIGQDLAGARNRETIQRLFQTGHEIANHSFHHFYDLTRRGPHVQEQEVKRAADVIEAITGSRPVGFRAPGYTVTGELLAMLGHLGFEYDSSVFPCPAYYAAKVAAIGWIAAKGRQSRSVADDPRVLLAPADPYRVGEPYWTRGEGICELPIGVTRDAFGRLPFIGTSLVLGGEALARTMTRAMVGRPLVNLELHGIDLTDAELDGLGFLRPYQPDLKKSAAEKEATLRAAILELQQGGYEFVTLAQACRTLPV